MVTLNSHAETFYYYRDMKNQLTTKIIHDIKQYDVSLLLNAHDELLFIDKTLLSLSYDLKVAQENEISVEFVIVLDRSSNEFYDRICFLLKKLGLSAKVIRVNYGSLGASRNLGIRYCSGKYICVADADDLTSSNCLTQMFKTITYLEGTGEVVAVFPEYVWNFGANNFVTRKLDSRFYQLKDWACIHPFCSKIMIKRSFLQYRGYQSYDKDSPFSYEDWEYNAFLLSKNVRLVTAPNTILFYRQHPNSMMRTSSKKVVPKLDVLSPEVFMRAKFPENSKKTDRAVDVNVLNKLASEAKEVDCQVRLLRSASQVYSQLASVPRRNWTDNLKEAYGLTGSISFDSVFYIMGRDIESPENYSQLKKKVSQLEGVKLIVCVDLSNHSKKQFYDLMTLDGVVVLDFSNFFGWLRFENKKHLLQSLAMSICKRKGLFFVDKKFDGILNVASLKSTYTVIRNLDDFSDVNNSSSVNYSSYLRNIYEYLTSSSADIFTISPKDIEVQLLSLPRVKKIDLNLISSIVVFLKKNSFLFNIAKRLYLAYCNFQVNRYF